MSEKRTLEEALQANAEREEVDFETFKKQRHITDFGLKIGFLHSADLSCLNLDYVEIAPGTSLCNVNLSHTSLQDSVLEEVKLNGANLSHTNLSRASLYKAILDDANCSEACFDSANLFYTNAIGTDFSGANLHDADLASANLENAKLYGADLSFALLDGTGITEAQLKQPNSLKRTTVKNLIHIDVCNPPDQSYRLAEGQGFYLIRALSDIADRILSHMNPNP